MPAKRFSVRELIDVARRRTGLSDLGPDDFLEGLEAMIAGFNSDVVVPADRIQPFREQVVRLLTNRLWFQKDLVDHPEILDEEIVSPIIISSLPRTGSTKLHRMLGSTGDFQTASLWKNHMFARIPGQPDGGCEQRRSITRAYEGWIYTVSPGMITGHPIFTDEPEEELMLMLHSFRSVSMTLYGSASLNAWAFTADPSPAYDYLKQQLQYLQWQFPQEKDKPWLLKSPVHFGMEAQLCRIFDRPRFIVTHRDPAKVVPSVTNITQNWVVVYTEPEGNQASAAMMSEMCARQVVNHMAWRDASKEVAIHDIAFRDINAESYEIAEPVYDKLGIVLTRTARNKMSSWCARHPRDKHGKNIYSAEQLGTTEEAIRSRFTRYIKRFQPYL